MAGARYGLLLGLAFFVFTHLAPQPAGAITLFGLFTLQLSWAAVIYWRRTGLPFATAAMVNGAVMSLCVVVLAAIGHPFPDMAPESWVFFVGGGITGTLLMRIESQVNHTKCKELARFMEHKSVWDIVTGRHIPQIR